MKMKKWIAVLLLIAMALTLTACGSKDDSSNTATTAPTEAPAASESKPEEAAAPADGETKAEAPAAAEQPAEAAPVSDHPLSATYGFQWMDPTAPILNDKGAQELSFQVYSS